ncbi:MAG TPA: glycosyltransferase family 9 protein [bacterium]|nr:glycosyltransferase family 9 protein [bacterium]
MNKNLISIKNKSTQLYQLLKNSNDNHLIYISGKCGDITVFYRIQNRSYSTQSKNFEKENERLLAKIPNDSDNLVIFGTGNGSILKKINYKKFTNVFVIEPSVKIFKSILLFNDLTDIISESNLHFIILFSTDDFNSIFNDVNLLKSKIAFISFSGYEKLSFYFYNYVKNFFAILEEGIEKKYSNLLLMAEKFIILPKNSNLILENVSDVNFTKKKVLIIQLSSIGDLIYSIPVFYGLKNKFKGIEISLLTDDYIAPLMKKIPFLNVISYSTTTKNEYHIFDIDAQKKSEANISSILGEIDKIKPDIVINLHASLRSAVIVNALHIPFLGLCYNSIFNSTVRGNIFMLGRFESISGKSVEYNEIITKENILQRSLGIKNNIPLYLPKKNGVQKTNKIIGIMAGSNSKIRRWQTENYAALIDLIAQYYPGYKFYLFGGQKEIEINKDIITKIKSAGLEKIIDYSGSADIVKTSELIQTCAFFIGNDTGLSHIAAAYSIPSITIQGQKKLGGGSFSYNNILISSIFDDKECGNCNPLSKECFNSTLYKCYQNITPNKVFNLFMNFNKIIDDKKFAQNYIDKIRKKNISIFFYNRNFFDYKPVEP